MQIPDIYSSNQRFPAVLGQIKARNPQHRTEGPGGFASPRPRRTPVQGKHRAALPWQLPEFSGGSVRIMHCGRVIICLTSCGFASTPKKGNGAARLIFTVAPWGTEPPCRGNDGVRRW